MKTMKEKCTECGKPPHPQLGYALGKCTCESPLFKMVEVESCPICERELHSIITRRVGEIGVCLHCGDTLNPLVNAIAEALVGRATDWMTAAREQLGGGAYTGRSLPAFVLNEIDDYFAPVLRAPNELKALLK